MAHVTLKRPADSRAATVTVPGGTEYAVRENGTIEVHPDHAHHLRAAGFLWPHEVEEDPIVIASEAPADQKPVSPPDGADKTPEQLEAERLERKALRDAEKAAKKAAEKAAADEAAPEVKDPLS